MLGIHYLCLYYLYQPCCIFCLLSLCSITHYSLRCVLTAAVVTVYGSAVSGFMLATSDLNVDITTNEAPRVLTELVEQLRGDKSGKSITE